AVLVRRVRVPGSERIGAEEDARCGERQRGAGRDRLRGDRGREIVVGAAGRRRPGRPRGDGDDLYGDGTRAGVLVGHGALQRVARGDSRLVERQRRGDDQSAARRDRPGEGNRGRHVARLVRRPHRKAVAADGEARVALRARARGGRARVERATEGRTGLVRGEGEARGGLIRQGWWGGRDAGDRVGTGPGHGDGGRPGHGDPHAVRYGERVDPGGGGRNLHGSAALDRADPLVDGAGSVGEARRERGRFA